jgi:hypothetical protein
MAESSWSDKKRGHTKNFLWIIAGIIAVGIAAGLFVRNNSDILLSSDKKKLSPTNEQPALPQSVQDHKTKTAAPPAVETSTKHSQSQRTDTVSLTGIICKLVDKSQPKLRVSLNIVFLANDGLKKEILVKRDNLKVMVQKTMSGESLDDIVIDSLRNGLKSGLNSLLEKGEIADLEFKEFTLQQER